MKTNDTVFTEYVKESFSIAQVIKKCGLKPVGGNYRTIKTRIKDLNLDTSHFTGQGHLKGKTHKNTREFTIDESFVKGGTLTSFNLSKKIRKYNLKPYECSNPKCNIGGTWLGDTISLHLDHIDGDNTNNELNNLRFLCPNCHSQTSTYCGKNKKLPDNTCIDCGTNIRRNSLRCVSCNDHHIKEQAKSYCVCGELKDNDSKQCKQCDSKTRFLKSVKDSNRPPYDELKESVLITGYSKTGKIYNVSDNTIRKWIKQYEKYS